MDKTFYSSFDVCKVLSDEKRTFPKETLKDWQDRKFIAPTVAAQGKGTKALYTKVDVYGIGIFKHLVEDVSLSRDVASRFMNGWKVLTESWLKRSQGEPQEKLIADLISNELIFLICTDKKGNEQLLYAPFSFHGKDSNRFDAIMRKLRELTENRNWGSIVLVNFRKITDRIEARLKLL